MLMMMLILAVDVQCQIKGILKSVIQQVQGSSKLFSVCVGILKKFLCSVQGSSFLSSNECRNSQKIPPPNILILKRSCYVIYSQGLAFEAEEVRRCLQVIFDDSDDDDIVLTVMMLMMMIMLLMMIMKCTYFQISQIMICITVFFDLLCNFHQL